jgi:hypothetical protein
MALEKLLTQKRKKAAYKLVIPVIGDFIITAFPTPTLEVPIETLVATTQLAIFFDIWKLYFEEDIEESYLQALLNEMGMTDLLGSISTFLATKLANAAVGEIGNAIPGIGWVVKGLISIVLTLVSGFLWINFCESVYRKKVQSSSASAVQSKS